MRYSFRILPEPLPLQQYLLKRFLFPLPVSVTTSCFAARRAFLLLTTGTLAEEDFHEMEVEAFVGSWRRS